MFSKAVFDLGDVWYAPLDQEADTEQDTKDSAPWSNQLLLKRGRPMHLTKVQHARLEAFPDGSRVVAALGDSIILRLPDGRHQRLDPLGHLFNVGKHQMFDVVNKKLNQVRPVL